MKYFIPRTVSISDSSISANTDDNGTAYSSWDRTVNYQKDTIVAYGGTLVKAFTNIYPLATYTWNDSSQLETPKVIRLSDNATIDPTTVPCVKDVTVVYVVDTWKDGADTVVGKYFQFTGTTGNIDFTAINPVSPANFTEILNYRYEDHEPLMGQNSLFWEYLQYTNRAKPTDKSMSSQSVVENTTEEWWEFETNNPDRVSLFNIEAEQARIIVYTTDINNPLYDNTTENLYDYSSIINWRTLVRYIPIYKKNVFWSLPFITGTVKIRVYLISSVATTLRLGEILEGEIGELAITEDGIALQIKSSGIITERPNGEVVFEDEGDQTKVYTTTDFNLVYNSDELDSVTDKCSEIINRRIVIYGENTDSIRFQTLVIYGFIRDASPTFDSNMNKSNLKIKVQRFI